MDWLYPLLYPSLALFAVAIAAGWFWRRRRVARGLRCWNCGADLTHRRLHVDAQRRSRCPACGEQMDVTDSYKMFG